MGRPVLPTVLSAMVLLLPAGISVAQPVYNVVSLEGTAKVQRSQKRNWEKIAPDGRMADNDLVETFFQTKLVLEFGAGNVVIIGSNSKALLNIVEKEIDGDKRLESSLTLFGGGIFVKAVSQCRINVFTTNAVCELDTGSVSCVAEPKRGETGFQVLGGSAMVRNVAQQKGKALSAGLTTMILPGKEPTAPLYITNRHVAVLKHFFGDEYITNEMDVSGIKPTDDRAVGGRAVLSQSLEAPDKSAGEQGVYKAVFSFNKVYGSILDDHSRESAQYSTVEDKGPRMPRGGDISLRTAFAFRESGMLPSVYLTPDFWIGPFEAAIRIMYTTDYRRHGIFGVTSLDGVLDKIDKVVIGYTEDSTFLHAGRITDLTYGYGLLVDNFENRNPNLVFQPLGLKGQWHWNSVDVRGFLADATDPRLGGAHLSLKPSLYYFGLGYYFDRDQLVAPGPPGSYRFGDVARAGTVAPVLSDGQRAVHAAEIDFGADIIATRDLAIGVSFEFSQKLLNGNDGYAVRMPSFHLNWRRMDFGVGFLIESGRLLSGQFGPDYMANSSRVKIDNVSTTAPVDTILLRNAMLSEFREALGVSAYCRANPMKRASVDFSGHYTLTDTKTIAPSSTDSAGDSSIDIGSDYSYRLTLAIGDSVVPFIRYIGVHAREQHGALNPRFGGAPANSWGFQAGVDIVSRPLLFRTALEAGAVMYHVDLEPHDDRIGTEDRILELHAGARWSF